MDRIFQYFVDRPRVVTGVMVGLTLVLAVLAAAPSLAPKTFPFLHPVKIDTDPENMLAHDEPVRVFHDRMKKELSLYDMVVVGVVNEENPQGVFNPESLRRVYELAEHAGTLRWEKGDGSNEYEGVIEVDIIAPSTVDNIEQAGLGSIRFEWLMRKPPETQAEAEAVREKAMRIPFLEGTLVSDDGKALAMYLPLTSKDQSYRVASALEEKIAEFEGDDEFHITGLPVAEDTFGVEMFIQMVVCAPMAMVVIFLLILYFFRKLTLALSPMIVALVSVAITMSLLIITGNTIHIMSSMIPIFIMPIAVLDAVHILSEFFDRYQETRDRRQTILKVMRTLFAPMLFTSLTTAVGFASLALAPIPPVQVFGLFVGFGVLMAWLWTMAFIPAFIMFIPAESLKNFGLKPAVNDASHQGLMSRMLYWTGRFTYRAAAPIMVAVAALAAVSAYGISKININDNPVKWFEPGHPIRVADSALNAHFGGTYMAYLTLRPSEELTNADNAVETLKPELNRRAEQLKSEDMKNVDKVFDQVAAKAAEIAKEAEGVDALYTELENYVDERSFDATDDEYDAWNEAMDLLSRERQKTEVFKSPEVLRYMTGLQEYLKTIKNEDGLQLVGKSNSLTDIVKTVYRELTGGEENNFRVPDTNQAVAQTLLQYQNSHRPQDLWHFVTPDFRTTSLWIQLKSGDNRDMSRVVEKVDAYIAENPPPVELKHDWFGLTYINVIWQDKMVSGMLSAFMGSFLTVLLMMIFLFRSALWGLLCMIPLTLTIGIIYGVIGLIGKDYDMPVAVLSSLSLGLAVDYAIHFLARGRRMRQETDSWKNTVEPVFGEPGRAIARNVLVIGVGFLPLLLAPLVPYQTVGVFIAAILLTAGVATLIILPAMIRLLEPWLFPATENRKFSCQCGTCVIASITAVALVVVNVAQFLDAGVTTLTWTSIASLAVLLGICAWMSRREACRIDQEQAPEA